MKKIFLIQLPQAVEQALSEQIKAFRVFDAVTLPKGNMSSAAGQADLVVTGVPVELPGCPILPLTFDKPKRLGLILRQMAQMISQPVLYMDDITVGSYLFRPQDKLLSQPDREDIALTDREVDILAYLVRYSPRPVSREELLKNVWQYQEGIDTHTLETHIYRLRQKIEDSADAPCLLLTVEGGYALHLSPAAI